jgi:hypothetical protein
MEEFQQTFTNESALNTWVQKWVFDCTDQETYLNRLGHAKQHYLYGKSLKDSWVSEVEEQAFEICMESEISDMEWLITSAADRLARIIEAHSYHTIAAGPGASTLTAWLAALSMKAKGDDIELMGELGCYGYAPRPADPYLFNTRNMPTAMIYSDLDHIMGVFMTGPNNRCAGIIDAVLIDSRGNINSTRVGEDIFLIGSGTTNDIASNAIETIAICPHQKRHLVEKLDYITCPGMTISTLVTHLGIFRKKDPTEPFMLVAYHETRPEITKDEAVEVIRANCGWSFEVSPELEVIPPPTPEELLFLRLFDPKKQMI